MSVGEKGRPGPQTGSRGFQCKFCEITLASRDTLKEHSLRKHAWDIQTGAAASPEVLSKLKVRDAKKVEKKGNKKTEGDTQDTGSRELFGEISDGSDVEVGETGPPGSSEVSLTPGQPRKTPLPPPIHLLNVLLSLQVGTTLPIPLIKLTTLVRKGGLKNT